MSRLLYFVFLSFTIVAITKTFAKYRDTPIFDGQAAKERGDDGVQKRIDFFREKYDYLKAKSIELDNSVETNDKLYYITHSDNFEEALFLIDYLSDRFFELGSSTSENIDVAVADIGFYLQRLDENLAVVEDDLESLGLKKTRLVKR